MDLSALLEETAARHEVTLAADTHLVCHGHAALLRRALDNVLQNAVRYSPEGNPPTLSATCKEGCVVICVRDFGPGVPEEALVDMFRPFYRAVPNDAHGVGIRSGDSPTRGPTAPGRNSCAKRASGARGGDQSTALCIGRNIAAAFSA